MSENAPNNDDIRNDEEGLLRIDGDMVSRATCRVTVRYGGQIRLVDQVRIFSESSRARLARNIMTRLGIEAIDEDTVLEHLNALATRAAANPNDTQPTEEASTATATELDTPEDREAAAAMLRDPELLRLVLDDIVRMQVVGERDLAALVYLTGVSRLLDKPLAVICRGVSSSGKSFSIERVAKLFPPECKLEASSLTPNALFYLEPGSLVHKFVVVGERSLNQEMEAADATRALREMLSAGKLSKLVPVKDKHGRQRTVHVQQDGPIAYVESTSLTKVFTEDQNRCLLAETDETETQTLRIRDSQSERAEGIGADPQMEASIVKRHHAVQRLLQPQTIVIPFARILGRLFGLATVETRRLYPQLLSLVHASALLHQFQRQRDCEGRVMADLSDYAVARALIIPSIILASGATSNRAADFFRQQILPRIERGKTFTTRQAKGWETSSKSSVLGWLHELTERGALTMVTEAKGPNPAVWQLDSLDLGPPVYAWLPTVEQIEAEVANSQAATTPSEPTQGGEQ